MLSRRNLIAVTVGLLLIAGTSLALRQRNDAMRIEQSRRRLFAQAESMTRMLRQTEAAPGSLLLVPLLPGQPSAFRLEPRTLIIPPPLSTLRDAACPGCGRSGAACNCGQQWGIGFTGGILSFAQPSSTASLQRDLSRSHRLSLKPEHPRGWPYEPDPNAPERPYFNYKPAPEHPERNYFYYQPAP